MEEFGKAVRTWNDTEKRNEVYRNAHQQVEDSARDDGALKGSLFWNWETDLIRSPGSYEVNVGDSTFQLVEEHAKRMKEIRAEKCAFPC